MHSWDRLFERGGGDEERRHPCEIELLGVLEVFDGCLTQLDLSVGVGCGDVLSRECESVLGGIDAHDLQRRP